MPYAYATWELQNIGIVSSGNLGAMLYNFMHIKHPHSNIVLYARNKTKAASITDSVCDPVEDLLIEYDVIFTTTSSASPIIHNITQGTNKAIIALGSDDEHKSEISPNLFEKADMIIVDSKLQAAKLGDRAWKGFKIRYSCRRQNNHRRFVWHWRSRCCYGRICIV